MDSSVTRIFAPFYSSAFSWNFALGMTQLLIPLYARDLGYSGVAIGSLIALPIIVQMIFNLIGGAWTDRLGGMNIAGWGFGAGFWTVAAMGVLSFASGLVFRYAPPAREKAPLAMLATYRMLLGRRSIHYGIMCAYISALPFSLSVSFYPILLIEQGFGSEAAGWLVGMRALGAIAAGVVLARFVKHADDSSVPLASALAIAASVGLVAFFTNPAIIAFFLFGVGLGSGVMTIYFQILVSTLSSGETRGSAMALAGMGWSISHISTPLVMGALKDLYGIHAAFYALGAFAFLFSFALPPVHRWSLARGKPR